MLFHYVTAKMRYSWKLRSYTVVIQQIKCYQNRIQESEWAKRPATANRIEFCVTGG